MEKYRHLKIWKLLGSLYILSIVYFSLRKVPLGTSSALINDKILHTLSYAIGAYWFGQWTKRTHIVLVFMSFSLLGFCIEILQGKLGYRFYDLFDQWANMGGAFLGCLIILLKIPTLIDLLEKFLRK